MNFGELQTDGLLSTVNDIIEKILGLTQDQLTQLNKTTGVLSLEALQRELDVFKQRPSHMVEIANVSVGFGCSFGFSMDMSRRDAPDRFYVHLLGGMNGYDAIQNNENFCNKKPTKFYNFDDCLKVFEQYIEDVRA
ncbi:unnamed protein product [Adineta ricciae]|uniref:Uncharacterized protein n=1 Tax=Adineta ricciae TaxID=249248 RepID=A0A813SM20_ADIRI|nr:unnamed protein product [Adineta ricciae]CAF1037855.1 unnamed protein product [Adineta ricciae]